MQTFDRQRENIFAPLGTAPSTLSREAIEALPQGTNATVRDVLLQLPGVSQDAANQGGLHVRNEHAYVSYRINGILLPDGLGAFGQYLDSSWVGSVSLITGALPAQYGLRTAGVVDITTAKFDNVGEIGTYMGSRHTSNSSIQYGGTAGSTEYFISGRYLQTALGLDNVSPALNALHDHSTQDRSFAYISTIIDPTTRLSFIGGTATNYFQIPDRLNCGTLPNPAAPAPTTCSPPNPFTAFGIANYPSWQVDENQRETYKFGVLALQKSTTDADFQLAYFMRTSAIAFTPDRIGDLMYNGVATDVYRGSIVNGVQGDSAFRLSDAHTVRAGIYASAEKTTVSGASQLLPIDPVAVVNAPGVPDTPFPAIDTSVLLGWLGGVYLQDEWRITDRLTLNTGARFDQMWQYVNANQLSPRVSLTYNPFDGTIFHAGYARTFTPPVQVIAAPSHTNLFTTCPPSVVAVFPTCSTVQAPGAPPPYSPLVPERANVYDIGVVQKVWPGLELGIDAYLKTTRDLLDDGQFGAAYVLNGFNYTHAQNVGVELKAVYTNGNFRAYANWAWAVQRATHIVSNQYLFGPDELAYIQNNWIYTDHAQVWSGSGGVSYLWNGTRFTTDVIYGSGLRAGDFNTDHVAPYAQLNAGVSREFYIPGWNPITARFDVINVTDTSYALRNGSGIGVFAPQYGPRRGYYFGLAQKFGPGANKPKAPPPAYIPVSVATWTWAGFYLGGNVGGSTATFKTDTLYSDNFDNPLFATSSSLKHHGALGGAQAGYNWQWGAAVAGLEADVVFGHQRTTTASACDGALCNGAIAAATGSDVPVAVIHQHNLDWFGTLRGRLGAAVTPGTLVYGTGGLAFGEVEHLGTIYGSNLSFMPAVDANGNPILDANGNPIVDANGNPVNIAGLGPVGNNFVSRSLRAGWAAGAGIEARLGGNWTGKLEYLHIDLGRETALAWFPSNATPIGIAFNSRITQDMVRLGLNYKFDPYYAWVPVNGAPVGPVVERGRPVYKGPSETMWTWAGFYFGANAGFATGSFNNSTTFSDPLMGTPAFEDQSSVRLKGGIGGVQTGYNLQWGSWLAGVETDLQFSSQRNITTSICPGTTCVAGVGYNPPVTLDQSLNLDWFGTVRGRLGVAVTPDVVAYATGGLAVGGIAHSVLFSLGGITNGIDSNGAQTGSPMTFTGRSTKAGYAIGGGVETHLGGNVTGKIEYLHMNFGSDSAVANSQSTPPILVALNSHVTDDVVRLGINYKFDPNASAPVYETVTKSANTGAPLVLKSPVPWLWTWDGYYLGINAGYGFGRSNTDAFFNDNTLGTAYGTNASDRVKGRVLGMQTGYNFTSGPWLWGIEADMQLTAQVGNPVFTCPVGVCNPAGPVVAAFDQDQRIQWFATLRQRAGVLVNPDLLVYATGGAAVASIVTAGNVFGFDALGNAATNAFSNISIHAGWAAGAGIEAHLVGHWTGKVEYLHTQFGSATTNINNQLNMPLTAQFNSRVSDQLVRAGLNYKFDPLAPGDAVLITKDAIVAPWTWAGFYAGFNLGYGTASSDTDTLLSDPNTGNPLFATEASSSKLRGAIYGAQAGYNLVAGNWLAGVELDFQGSSQKGTRTSVCPGAICNPAITAFDAPVTARLQQRLEWFSTLRARLGAVVDGDTLGYFTGGLALGRISTRGTLTGSSLTVTPVLSQGTPLLDDTGNPVLDDNGNPVLTGVGAPAVDANGNPVTVSTMSPVATTIEEWTTKVGWSAGAGIERHIAGNVTAKLEYLHLDFGKISGGATSLLSNAMPVTFTYNHRVTNDIVRLGVNYKFDPVVEVGLAPTKGPILTKDALLPLWSWAGLYVGFNAGYGSGSSTLDTAFSDAGAGTPLFADHGTYRTEGGVYGVQAGYNWVAGRWLAGLEMDVQYSAQRSSLSAACPAAACNPALIGVITNPAVNVTFGDSPQVDWFATLRSRVGVSVTPDTLLYATGGAAVSQITTDGTIFGFAAGVDVNGNPAALPGNTVFGHHATKTGWSAGGGVEAHLGGNWTGKVEYLYLDFGSVSGSAFNVLNSTPLAVVLRTRVVDHVARAGLNYKFD